MALKKTTLASDTTVVTPATPASKHLAGPENMRSMVDVFTAASSIFDAAKSNLDQAKANLVESAYATWLDAKGSSGSVVFTGSTSSEDKYPIYDDMLQAISAASEANVNDPEPRELRIDVKDQYSSFDDKALPAVIEIIGEPNADALFTYKESVTIDLNVVDDTKRTAFIEACKAAAAALGIDKSVVAVKQVVSPIKGDFHTKRHHILTRDQNLRLQESGAVKTTISVNVVKPKKK